MNYQIILLFKKKNWFTVLLLAKIWRLVFDKGHLWAQVFEETLYLPKGLNLSNNRSTRLGMFFLKGSDGLLSMGDSSTLGLINLSRWAQVWFSPEAYFT